MSKRKLTILYPWYWEIALVIIVCWALWGLTVLFLGDVNQERPQVGTAIGVQNVYASGLSDETKELVEDLKWKHYYCYEGELFGLVSITGDDIVNPIFIDDMWTDTFLSMWVEDGKFFVETQDGKWFIEMEKVVE